VEPQDDILADIDPKILKRLPLGLGICVLISSMVMLWAMGIFSPNPATRPASHPSPSRAPAPTPAPVVPNPESAPLDKFLGEGVPEFQPGELPANELPAGEEVDQDFKADTKAEEPADAQVAEPEGDQGGGGLFGVDAGKEGTGDGDASDASEGKVSKEKATEMDGDKREPEDIYPIFGRGEDQVSTGEGEAPSLIGKNPRDDDASPAEDHDSDPGGGQVGDQGSTASLEDASPETAAASPGDAER